MLTKSISRFTLATIVNGNQLASTILNQLKLSIQSHPNINKPSLGIVLVGDSVASKSYVNKKLQACAQIGVDAQLHHFQEDIKQPQLLEHIANMHGYDGILVQLPLPAHLDRFAIIHSIPQDKDVDCLHMHNLQKIMLNGELNALLPCTPAAVLAILDHHNIQLKGKSITIIGRSFLVGLPLSLLLMKRNATITVCHRHTLNLQQSIMQADIVVSAAGCANLVTQVKPGAIIVDVGINRGLKPKSIVGDVDFNRVFPDASLITPVPGGVGPMTVCMLMRNVYNIWCSNNNLPIQYNPNLEPDYLDE